MPKKTQKPNFTPIIITLTIDPALKLNAQGERAMSTSIIARRGNVAQLSQVDVTNWKTDLPGEVDRLVRLLLGGGLVMPVFPNMGDARATGGEAATDATMDQETETNEDAQEEAETSETEGEGEEANEEVMAQRRARMAAWTEERRAEAKAEYDAEDARKALEASDAEIDNEIRQEANEEPDQDIDMVELEDGSLVDPPDADIYGDMPGSADEPEFEDELPPAA